jgi:AP-3 complex subunit delta-1
LQERAAELGGLLELVRKGLDSPRPAIERSSSNGFNGEQGQDQERQDGEKNGFASSNRAAPTSLTILDSLFFLYELNPVNPKAQSMVALPEGLDLDATINPLWGTEKDGLELSEDEELDDFGRPVRRKVQDEGITTKKKKGKGTTKKGSSKKKGSGTVSDLADSAAL